MAKTIIFCADGTWNGPGKDDEADPQAHPTNVLKLFHRLAGTNNAVNPDTDPEQERTLTEGGAVTQIAKYLHGVGASDNPIIRLIGGATGAGIISRIVRGYTFISRNYEPGAKIFLVGFSRGAYTARALSGLIAARGLLDVSTFDASDKETAYAKGAAVWVDWREDAIAHGESLLSRLREVMFDLPAFLQNPVALPALIPNVPIEAVGVWDTVGSYGIPIYVDQGSRRADIFRFADHQLSGKIKAGFHAVALDEQRTDFTPTLWDSDTRVVQMLFAGAHSDVGGGYLERSDSGLSDCALRWMLDQLKPLGVRLDNEDGIQPDPRGIAHQPWMKTPFDLWLHGPRLIPPGIPPTSYLTDRLNSGPVPNENPPSSAIYRPVNLPR